MIPVGAGCLSPVESVKDLETLRLAAACSLQAGRINGKTANSAIIPQVHDRIDS